MPGSIRGRRQETSAARQATVAQQRVPTTNAPRPPPSTRVQRGNGASTAAPSVGVGHAAPPRAAAVPEGAHRAGIGGHAAPQAAAGARPKTYAAAVAAASTTSANGGGGVQPSSNSAGPRTSQGAQDVAMSAVQRLAEDEIDEPADEVHTMPEEADDQRSSKEINLHMLKIEKVLERRRRALDKAEIAVAEQKEEIASQQAKLVELQTVEDGKREEIFALNEEKRVLSQRLARINAAEDAAQQNQHSGVTSGMAQQDPLQMAAECLSRSFMGLQNFNEQPPQIKELLLQFARGVEQLQAAERAAPCAGQVTLEQSFAAQQAAQARVAPVESHDEEFPLLAAAVQRKRDRESSPVDQQPTVVAPATPHVPVSADPIPERQPAPPAGAESDTVHYNISSGAATPVATVQPAMATSTGSGYGKAPRKHEPLCKKCWAVVCKCSVPVVNPATLANSNGGTDVAMEASGTALVVWQPPKTRAQLLQQLEAKNDLQAARAMGRDDEVSSSRPSPY